MGKFSKVLERLTVNTWYHRGHWTADQLCNLKESALKHNSVVHVIAIVNDNGFYVNKSDI